MTSRIVFLFALSLLTCVSARQNFDCQLFELDVQFADPASIAHHPKWHCLPDPARGEFYALEDEDMPSDLLEEVKAGGKWLHISGPFVNPGGRVPPGAAISIAARQKNGLTQGGRRRGPIGTSRVLVVRARFSDAAPTDSLDAISDSVFGNGNDPVNVASQYNACSKGQLTLVKGSGNENVANGMLDILVPQTITTLDSYQAEAAAATEANRVLALGTVDTSLAAFDHVMFCLPPGTNNGGWIAYGYYNWYRTVYNDRWCTYVSAQMHEFGHNLELRHSGEGVVWKADGTEDNAYRDQTGMMGYSYSGDDTPLMCFNPIKSYLLGWFADCVTDVTDPSVKTKRNLVGTADYQPNSCAQDDAVVLRVETGVSFDDGSRIEQRDLYVGYNKRDNTADGTNSGTKEYANMVTIVDGSKYQTSDLKAALSVGGQYTTGDILIKFCELANGKAVVGVGSVGQDPCVFCAADADCDNGDFCDGAETCVGGVCVDGTAPCAGQQCDETADTCVECLADTDCSGATPVCDGNGVCVACLANADCDNNVFCDGVETCNTATNTCQSGAAPTCDDGKWCNGAETCDAASDTCVAGAAQCQGVGKMCDESGDACVECLANSDCDNGLFCDGAETCTAGMCAPGVTQCQGAGEFCSEAKDACVACLADADCDNGDFCDGAETCSAAGTCVPAASGPCTEQCDEAADSCVECLANSDCSEPTPLCSGNVCVACLANSDCDNGDFCDGAETCNAGSCVAASAPCAEQCDEAADTCVECLADSDCSGDTPVCSGNVCVGCTVDADCDNNNVCDGVETCSAGACQAGTALVCDDGIFCNGLETCNAVGGCQSAAAPCAQACDEPTDTCVECVADSDCSGSTPFCAGNTCVACTVDADCGNNNACDGVETCSAGACQAGTALVCDDGIFCNGLETCNAVGGCQSASAPCQAATEQCNEATDTCVCSGVQDSSFPGCCCDPDQSRFSGKGSMVKCFVDGAQQSKGYTCSAGASEAPGNGKSPFLVGASAGDADQVSANRTEEGGGSSSASMLTLALCLGLGGLLMAGAAGVLAMRLRRQRREQAERRQMIEQAKLSPMGLKHEFAFDVTDATRAIQLQFNTDVEKGPAPPAESARLQAVL